MNDNDGWQPGEGEYAQKVTHAVLTAVVMANPDETGAGGFVDFPVAVDGMCAAIAVLAQQSRNFPNPRDARQFAEECGRAVAKVMKEMTEREARGDGYPWQLERVHKTH